jgi:hypothetical protein
LDLLGKLTSGREDEGLGLLERDIDALENRNGESGGFSGSGLGLRDLEIRIRMKKKRI